MRDRLAELGFSGRVPVFPLPETVFFPGVTLPLHVFEPRYRAMVQDAIAGEKLIAVATLLPGWEREEGGAPAFHPLATVGRLVQVRPLADGRFDIALLGLERVQLEEEYSDRPYRHARARVVPDRAGPADDPDADRMAEHLLVTYGYWLQLRRLPSPPITLPGGSVPFEAAVHTVCQNLDAPVVERLHALEARGPFERLPLARAMLAARLDAVLAERGLTSLRGIPGERN